MAENILRLYHGVLRKEYFQAWPAGCASVASLDVSINVIALSWKEPFKTISTQFQPFAYLA